MAGKERIWAVEAVVATAPEPVPEVRNDAPALRVAHTTAPTFERSAKFRKRLTDLGIFCEKRERDIMLDAFLELLKCGPYRISQIRRELPKMAKSLATEHGLCLATDFSRIVNFFIKLLLVSGTLLREDGTAIERNVGAECSAAKGLATAGAAPRSHAARMPCGRLNGATRRTRHNRA
jgi:hypothetical protein